ncbi:MAG TPA: gephyrin-like molybdotransferase Glp [Candidatus Tectomicrobia bacterium]|nr:gephyrin-like molybdotransferase Glp [Candidatus Tectomicrobia bacterium]
MLSVEEARAEILRRVRLLEEERVELLGALGRVLAAPVVSRRQIPPWANSSMDGYAVRAQDTAAGAALRVVGRVEAGAMPARALAAGEAFRIFTGAPMPQGADAVVPQEDVDARDDVIVTRAAVQTCAYVRPAGEDVQVGEEVLEPGLRLGAAEIGLLATLGWTQVPVRRRPRVAILSTGNELADLGTEPGPAQIPNTNTYSLQAQVLEAGGEPVNLGVARDRLEDIAARLAQAAGVDVLVSSAGVSVGDLDLVREALTRAGAELHLWQVSMRPGKPITFGSLDGRAVFGLPGNPVSAMVTFELFVRPALLAMMGCRRIDRPRIRARALEPIPNPGRRRGYLRVRLVPDADGFGARLTGEQGSAILRSLVAADGLAVVPGDTAVPVGGPVEVIVLRDLPA